MNWRDIIFRRRSISMPHSHQHTRRLLSRIYETPVSTSLGPYLRAMRLAEPVARRAVELDPDDASALGVHSVVMSFSGFREAAVEQAYRAMAISPNCAYAYHALGWSSLFQGSLEGRPKKPSRQVCGSTPVIQ